MLKRLGPEGNGRLGNPNSSRIAFGAGDIPFNAVLYLKGLTCSPDV